MRCCIVKAFSMETLRLTGVMEQCVIMLTGYQLPVVTVRYVTKLKDKTELVSVVCSLNIAIKFKMFLP